VVRVVRVGPAAHDADVHEAAPAGRARGRHQAGGHAHVHGLERLRSLLALDADQVDDGARAAQGRLRYRVLHQVAARAPRQHHHLLSGLAQGRHHVAAHEAAAPGHHHLHRRPRGGGGGGTAGAQASGEGVKASSTRS
jgi:hypothetical protein